eukprot:jgi/Chlat1/6538/Chrsp45S06075
MGLLVLSVTAAMAASVTSVPRVCVRGRGEPVLSRRADVSRRRVGVEEPPSWASAHGRRGSARLSALNCQHSRLQPLRTVHCQASENSDPATSQNKATGVASGVNYQNAVSTTAALARTFNSTITVLVIDPEDAKVENSSVRYDTIRFHFNECGWTNFDIVERKGSPAAVLGDVADELDAQLVVVSSDSIGHDSHAIDGNLVATFAPCPVLLLP